MTDEKIKSRTKLTTNTRHRNFERADEYTIELLEYNDGSIAFSEPDDEGFIFLYPEQIEQLKKILK